VRAGTARSSALVANLIPFIQRHVARVHGKDFEVEMEQLTLPASQWKSDANPKQVRGICLSFVSS